ncbi:MAG: hypothetical protein AcusKO_29580 [Acuticoccus sp.]
MGGRAARTAATAYPPLLLDENAAAAYVAMSVTTVRGLRAAHSFPPRVKVGGKLLYRRADLDTWALSLPTEYEAVEANERCEADEAFA